MEFRKAIESDIYGIMEVIKGAQHSLKMLGVDQWQNNYPNKEVLLKDITCSNSYALFDSGKIIATAMFSFEEEVTYNDIYQGQWLTDEKYAVIHRIAVDDNSKGKGVANIFLKKFEKICLSKSVKSIKIDTHKDNIVMRKFLEKNSFKYCGIIYLEDGDERVAYEKILD